MKSLVGFNVRGVAAVLRRFFANAGSFFSFSSAVGVGHTMSTNGRTPQTGVMPIAPYCHQNPYHKNPSHFSELWDLN